MKVVFLIGDSAVGKMTVGQELMKLTGLRLFHNHMTIEPVIEVFGKYNKQASLRIREVVFEEFAKSDAYGLIFTYMWAFNLKSEWDYIEHICNIFRQEKPDTEFYYIELVAPQEIRLSRNSSENRLRNKASKRDLEKSRERLLNDDRRYRFVSLDGEITFPNYMKIDNTDINAPDTAAMIKERFGL